MSQPQPESFSLEIKPGSGHEGANFLLMLFKPSTPLRKKRKLSGDNSVVIGSFENVQDAALYRQRMLEDLGVADIATELLGDLATGKRTLEDTVLDTDEDRPHVPIYGFGRLGG